MVVIDFGYQDAVSVEDVLHVLKLLHRGPGLCQWSALAVHEIIERHDFQMTAGWSRSCDAAVTVRHIDSARCVPWQLPAKGALRQPCQRTLFWQMYSSHALAILQCC